MKRSRIKVNVVLCSIISICFAVLTAIFVSANVLANNIWVKPDFVAESFCKTNDTESPVVVLNGDLIITLKVGESYSELGASVVDDCDEVELKVSGAVDSNTVGIYTIEYSATDLSGNRGIAVRTVSVIPEYHGTIYLTFDDGPGPYTEPLLNILAKYNVKATFFVTGYGDDELILREYNEGHSIGLHTYSHDYAYVYQGIDEYFYDLNLVQERVKRITGHTTNLIRFPGGSSNTVSKRYDGGAHIMSQLVDEVTAKGFVYFDWNISSGDAGGARTTEEVVENVIDHLVEYGDSVVLQHDVKDFSVDAVDIIIQYGLANGYVFKGLTADSFTAHHQVNN